LARGQSIRLWPKNRLSLDGVPGAKPAPGHGRWIVVRVNFTADDLARTRFSVAPAPLIETGLALVELRRASVTPGRPSARRWLREMRRTFPATARPLLELFGPYPPWPGFADSPASSLEEGLEFVRSTPRSAWRADLADGYLDRAGRPPCWVRILADGDTEAIDIVMRALRDFYAAVVAPRWESVVSSFHGDVARRMPVLAAGGYQALFGTLHRQLRWQDNGLERQGVDFEHDLGGTGMLMMPSAFWTGPPVFVLDGERIPNVLVYAAQPNGRAGGPDHASPSGEAGTTAWPSLSARPAPPCCARWPNRAARPTWPPRRGSARPRRRSTQRRYATRTSSRHAAKGARCGTP
jgi:hypothetical protein